MKFIATGDYVHAHPSQVIGYPPVEPHSTMVYRSGFVKPSAKNEPVPKSSRREMTSVEKGMITDFFHCLRNIALVAQIVGRPGSTIKSFLARACEHLSLNNLPHPGRPSLLSS